MRRGELYRVAKPSILDPKSYRVFVMGSLSLQKIHELNQALSIALELLA